MQRPIRGSRAGFSFNSHLSNIYQNNNYDDEKLHNELSKVSVFMKKLSLIDIPEHMPLESGVIYRKVYIPHATSLSIVYLMLNEDFIRACQLLRRMAIHEQFQWDYISIEPFKPEINKICACSHANHWFRCRILNISSDRSTATVIYLDWGMITEVQIQSEYIRYLPNEFYTEPCCTIRCRLDGVTDSDESTPSNVIQECLDLLSENEYDVFVKESNHTDENQIMVKLGEENINDKINGLIEKDELIQQFQFQLKLFVGSEFKALLSSLRGRDDSFYILIINENTKTIGQAISQLQEHHIPNRKYIQIPKVKTLVLARYPDHGKHYRAWVKSIDIENEKAIVYFVDFGNEGQVSFSDIYICPESIRQLPWLGIRVRLTNEKLTAQELTEFWKLAESNYIWIRINEVFRDAYGIQIKIDYTVYLRQERMKMFVSKNVSDQSVQIDEHDRSSFYDLYETVNRELRLIRNAVNEKDESSIVRDEQILQSVLSTLHSK